MKMFSNLITIFQWTIFEYHYLDSPTQALVFGQSKSRWEGNSAQMFNWCCLFVFYWDKSLMVSMKIGVFSGQMYGNSKFLSKRFPPLSLGGLKFENWWMWLNYLEKYSIQFKFQSEDRFFQKSIWWHWTLSKMNQIKKSNAKKKTSETNFSWETTWLLYPLKIL